jgi:hypothetical protein
MLKINSFSVGYAGTYEAVSGVPNSGTKINIKAIMEVVDTPITLKKQQEWCDGKVVMDFAYPADQPATPVGTFTYEENNYSHVPFALPFSLLGHGYKLRFDYDTNYVEAEARFFVPNEVMALAGIGIAVPAIILIGIYVYRKRK